MMTNLKDLGIKIIEISFSGSGDSGDIDDVYFNTYENLNISSEVINAFKEKSGVDIDDEIRDFAWEIVNDKVNTVGDCVNNEGGFGTIEIDVENQSYDLNYSQRTTEDYDWFDEMLFI